jgi:hypothetical protein
LIICTSLIGKRFSVTSPFINFLCSCERMDLLHKKRHSKMVKYRMLQGNIKRLLKMY